MIDGNYYLNLRQEEAKKFAKLTEILPIDDKLLYNGHVYQLTIFDISCPLLAIVFLPRRSFKSFSRRVLAAFIAIAFVSSALRGIGLLGL